MTNLTYEQKKELFEIEKAERIARIKEEMISDLKKVWSRPFTCLSVVECYINALLAAEATEFEDD